MPFKIIRNDITKVKADAIVNSANPYPVIGSGTDTAVYNAAGAELVLKERREIGRIARGEAAVTGAYNLQAKIIIHTVGPGWVDGNHGESEILRNCYRNSLALAAKHECVSIAFPLIATGNYGFPKDLALNIALEEIGYFLLTHEMDVILTVFDKESFLLSQSIVGDLEQFIDDRGAGLIEAAEYLQNDNDRRIDAGMTPHDLIRLAGHDRFSGEYGAKLRPPRQTHSGIKPNESQPSDGVKYSMKEYVDEFDSGSLDSDAEKKLEEVLRRKSESFSEMLFRLIDDKKLDDVTVYKRANIDRKLFSSIRCKPGYKPRKETAVALAIALELDLKTTEDLMSRAGLALSPSNKADLIVAYFISRKNFDIMEINAALFEYGQPLLGSV